MIRYKRVEAELTIRAYIMVKIDHCEGDDTTPPSTTVDMSDWDRKDVEQQLDKYVEDNQQEIMEE